MCSSNSLRPLASDTFLGPDNLNCTNGTSLATSPGTDRFSIFRLSLENRDTHNKRMSFRFKTRKTVI